MPHNEKGSNRWPSLRDKDAWLYILIGLLVSVLSDVAQPQRPVRPDTGEAAARAIVARSDSVLGLRDGRQPFRYSHTIAETYMTPQAKSVTEIWTMQPNKVFMRITMPGLGETQIGYNGSIGWTISPMTGPVLLEGEQLKEIEKQLKPQSPSQATFKKLSAGARTVVEGKNVVPVDFADDQGNAGTIYFDLATSLAHATKYTVVAGTPVEHSMLIVLGDYKRFDGVLTPTTLTMKTPEGMSMVTRTTHLDHAVIDTAKFTPPASVLSLIAKRP
jgi:hypothetical protein